MKENSIEEDIKILEEFKTNGYNILLMKYGDRIKTNFKLAKAIEHILSDYKRVLKENNRLEEQVEYDKTHIYTPQTIELNFILKSKIEDKIEELKINLVNMQGEELLIYESKIEALQELLEKEQ